MGREHFGSSRAAVLALAGSAIGLGNIWRFPFMVGQNGGAAFIIVYLVFTFLLALPIFFSEAVIGHHANSNTVGAMRKLAPGTAWKGLGFITIITPLIIVSYYSVVGGWSIGYLGQALTGGFRIDESGVVNMSFGKFISNPWMPLCFHTIFIGLCAAIVSRGVKSGIEKFNNITMPLLFVLILLIVAYSLSLPGSFAGVEHIAKPDFSKLNISSLAAAMGQSFFSLSLGVGTVLTYSSYIRKKDGVLRTGVLTATFDMIFAIIAGFAVIPAVFAAGLEPGAGPGLIFETLPYIFAKMRAELYPFISDLAGVLFFLSIVFAALTSAISMLEVGVSYLVDEKGMSRHKACKLIFFGTWLLGVLCSLSFGPLSDLKFFGKGIFDFCDYFCSNFLMTFGGLLFVLFAGWKMSREDVRAEFLQGGATGIKTIIFDGFYLVLKYLAPIGILLIFLTNFLG